MTLKRTLFASSIVVLGLADAHAFSTQNEANGRTSGHRHACGGAAADYLSTLSPTPGAFCEAKQQSRAFDRNGNNDIPDEHYSKNYPNAGWRGYANPQWGGYLDALPSNRLEEGKKSDYGNDIRWGAEVYLSSVEMK